MMDAMTLAGVWWRQSVVWPDGTKDETSRCIALVTHDNVRADVCLSEVAPAIAAPTKGRPLDAESVALLARQRGAIGTFRLDDGCCTQLRQIDFQPPARVIESARLHLHDDILIDDGVQVAYRAIWVRVLGPDVETSAWTWRAEHAGPRVVLVLVGDRFLLARERRPPLPAHRDGLAGLLMDLDARAQWRDLFECEVSYGEWGAAGAVITASTLPWREGVRLGVPSGGAPLAVDGLPAGHWYPGLL